ncbi:MAG TPA: zinc ribbon domain-containing protein [Ktedonobacterales bacterium]|nr:zinc ribbon domain-containing protein [Ktedonobacterales bacterium]
MRTHICPSCGLVEDRDVNAARNILQAGMARVRAGAQPGAPPSGTGAAGLPDELRSPRL